MKKVIENCEIALTWRTKMRRYTVEEEQIIKVVKCNKCGKEIFHDNNIIKEGIFRSITNGDIFRKKTGKFIHLICVKNVMIN